ncbi:MAG: OmpA family protein [Bacteroidia bacterium]|nr:OmpA family protein [Bacteroidia bacterium]
MQIEYLETRLWLLLETNRKYCVSLWISRADSFGGKADELGIYFSENQVDVYGKLYLTKLTPQITFTDSTALSNQVGWTRLCAVYEAKGGEEWLTLGAFRAKPGVRAHYFVDDVAVVAGESLLDCGCAGELAQPGQTYTLRNVNFAFDSADLLADSETELSKLLSFLQENPDFRIELAGHTDGMGGDAHNLDLSRRRAESVRNWLEAKGLAAGRVECKGYGASQPLNSEMTAEGRQANRRVEFRILTP